MADSYMKHCSLSLSLPGVNLCYVLVVCVRRGRGLAGEVGLVFI